MGYGILPLHSIVLLPQELSSNPTLNPVQEVMVAATFLCSIGAILVFEPKSLRPLLQQPLRNRAIKPVSAVALLMLMILSKSV